MCDVSDKIREAIVQTDAEGRWPDGKWWPFGTRAFTAALGLPDGPAITRIIVDIKFNAFPRVYVEHALATDSPDGLMALLASMPATAIVDISELKPPRQITVNGVTVSEDDKGAVSAALARSRDE